MKTNKDNKITVRRNKVGKTVITGRPNMDDIMAFRYALYEVAFPLITSSLEFSSEYSEKEVLVFCGDEYCEMVKVSIPSISNQIQELIFMIDYHIDMFLYRYKKITIVIDSLD